jgi:hypothetical protein
MANEKMLNIFSQNGKANQMYPEIPSHPNQNGYYLKNNVKDLGKKEFLYCWWQCNSTATTDNSMVIPPKTELPYI